MKKILFIYSFALIGVDIFVPLSSIAQGIGINASGLDPHPSAMLDVDALNKGFLPPRLNTTQRNAITAPATGLVIYNTDTKCINFFDGTGWRESCGSISYPLISSLNCNSATNSGTLTAGTPASGVNSVIPYTGGNGNPYSVQTVSSTGVTGLTATLAAGTLNSGSGTLTYNITGTPSGAGTATFAISIGGHSCNFSLTVTTSFTCGMNSVTFTYNGASVTYGTVVGANSKCWLDRNLGASGVALSSNDANSYGDLFQWGRGDDGHQIRTSSTTVTHSSSDTPGSDFIISPNNPFDWRSPQNTNLWQPSYNNPCPSGYRLPTEAELDAERASWSNQNTTGAMNSPLKLPLGGYRNNADGTLVNVDFVGYYWSSTVNTVMSRILYFGGSLADISNGYRGRGLSVRCIKN
jgi:hypothetical protein